MLTAEEKASKANKQEIKGTGMYFQINNRHLIGFNMEMFCSEKGRQMIEVQRDSRR